MDYEGMGLFFFRLRVESKITQKQLALILHLPASFISGFERGKKRPTIEALVKLCTFYDISFDIIRTFELSDRTLS